MTDTTQDQQFRTAAPKRRTRLFGAGLKRRRSAPEQHLKWLRRIVVALAQPSIGNVPTGGLRPRDCCRAYSSGSFAHVAMAFGKALHVGMITIQI
jgi:hypothetical protein